MSEKKKKLKEGVKYDQGKARYDLIAAHSLHEIIQVYTMGAEKYDDNNWRKGMKWGRVFGAGMRHMWAFWRGEDIDPESGLHHLAHAAWACITLLEYTKTRPGFDDRGDAIKELRFGKETKRESSRTTSKRDKSKGRKVGAERASAKGHKKNSRNTPKRNS